MRSSLHAVVKDVDDSGSGGWTAIVSSPTIDRDDEVIEAAAFEPCPRSVPVRDGHFGGEQVGSGRPYYRGAELWLDGRFARTKRAQEIRGLVVDGHLTSMSVVFLPLADRQVGGRRHISKGELLAVDWVSVPSNRSTQLVSVRGYRGVLTVEDCRRMVAQAQLDLAAVYLAEAKAMASPPPSSPAGLYRYADSLSRFLREVR